MEPRPGRVLVAADLPAAELHSLAQVCVDKFGHSVMADQLNAGRDLHVWFGSKIIGLEYQEAFDLYRAGDREIKAARTGAKGCNFGFPGGMGPASFVEFVWATYRIRMTFERAKELKGIWLAAYPEIVLFFEWINSLLEGNDRALVRHLRSGRWRGRCTYCQACNSQFQELTANGASDALRETSRRCYTDRDSALFLSRPVLYTHDEIVLETPELVCHDASMELGQIMKDRFNAWHPNCPVDHVEAFPTRIYSKAMEPVRGPDGRFVPWEQAA